MLKKIRIETAGDSEFLPGVMVDALEFEDEVERLTEEGKEAPTGQQCMLGITKASLATSSFLSAASFQETTRVLTEAAINGKVDPLIGLKENVIIGKLLPAGTGLRGALKSPETIARELEAERKRIELEAAEKLEAETLSEDLLSGETEEQFASVEEI